MKGRKPIPTEIKKQKGTFRKSRGVDEIKPELSLYPKPPEYLTEHGLEVWSLTVPFLTGLKILTQVDEQLLGAYCNEMGRYNEIAAKIKVNGILTKAPKNDYIMAHPLYARMKKSWKSATEIGVLFGITPSARTRVQAGKENKKTKLNNILNA